MRLLFFATTARGCHRPARVRGRLAAKRGRDEVCGSSIPGKFPAKRIVVTDNASQIIEIGQTAKGTGAALSAPMEILRRSL